MFIMLFYWHISLRKTWSSLLCFQVSKILFTYRRHSFSFNVALSFPFDPIGAACVCKILHFSIESAVYGGPNRWSSGQAGIAKFKFQSPHISFHFKVAVVLLGNIQFVFNLHMGTAFQSILAWLKQRMR